MSKRTGIVLRTGSVLVAAVAVWGIVSLPRIAEIRISKSDRRVLLLDDEGAVVRQYAAILGRNTDGPKEREGDERTPEGEYFVCVKNPRSRFHLSLGLNYPNAADAERGLRSGLVDPGQHETIAVAARDRARPPWDTPLGGEIFLHGEGEGRDGTRGCIAVSNDAIEEIFRLVDIGTRVRIDP